MKRHALIRVLRNAPFVALALLPLGLLAWFWYTFMPFEPDGKASLVARAELSCGEVMVTRTRMGLEYVVSFYFRLTGSAAWDEYFLDSDSDYWRGTIRADLGGNAFAVTYHGEAVATFGCQDRRLEHRRGRGRLYSPKARVADPMSRVVSESVPFSPMDLGARSNDFPGYQWSKH